jgi:hypothetical protein
MGGMGSILPQRSYTFACKWHNEAYWAKQDCADEEVKHDWFIFPHAWEEIWQWFVVNSALRFARVWSHGSQIDLCTRPLYSRKLWTTFGMYKLAHILEQFKISLHLFTSLSLSDTFRSLSPNPVTTAIYIYIYILCMHYILRLKKWINLLSAVIFLEVSSFHRKRRCRIPSYLFVDFVNHCKTLVMFRNASQWFPQSFKSSNVKVSKMCLC